jgi:hypothetical protein
MSELIQLVAVSLLGYQGIRGRKKTMQPSPGTDENLHISMSASIDSRLAIVQVKRVGKAPL